MDLSDMLFVGVKGHVIAFCKRDGTEVWRASLGGGFALSGDRFVVVLPEGVHIYAHTYGRLYCLDARTGTQLWMNELTGLGYDIAMLAVAGTTAPSLASLIKHRLGTAAESEGMGRG